MQGRISANARSQVSAELGRWFATMQVFWANQLAYKLNILLYVLGPILVFYFIRYNLWQSIFDLQGIDEIGGYSRSRMLEYQIWVLVVQLIANGFQSMQLSEDIRLGRISSYLIYPFDFWRFHAASFVAFQMTQSLIAILSIVIFFGSGFLVDLDPSHLLIGFCLSWVVGVLWFACQFTLGLISFWLEESWTLRVMFGMVASFFSGALIPLELFPEWLRELIYWLPFPYMTHVPVKYFMGEWGEPIGIAFAILATWLAIVVFISSRIWARGLRLYTAAGM